MSNSNVKYRSIAFGTWDVGDARKVVEEKYYGFRNKKDGCSMSVDNSTPSTPTTSATNTLSGYTSSSTPTSNESTSTKSFEDCLSSSETIATSSNSRLDKR
uniref:Uncharacterized protein n=1 Tax=Rhabditophanes sp. KR3021 TaxID=114890 RepID=A0AC35U3G1_9BILA